MDVRVLRQIVAIKEHGSFAKAAEALGVAQPSLSKNIARLEDELKIKLFLRTASGSELTSIGEMIAERAERVISEARNLIRDAALLAGGEAGQVRLGLSAALREALIPELLGRIAERHPGLRLHMEFGQSNYLLPGLRSRQFDLVLCALAPHVAVPEFESSEIVRAEGIVVAAPTHPLASERDIPTSRLGDFRCAGVNVEAFRNTTLFPPTSRAAEENLSHYTSNDYGALLPLVRTAGLVLAAPSFVVQEDLARGRLVRLDVDWRRRVAFGAVTTPATRLSPIIGRIIGYAQEIGAELEAEWARLQT